MNCKCNGCNYCVSGCGRVLSFVEEFAHLSEHGREEGICHSCFSAKKELEGNTIQEGPDLGQGWNNRLCSYGCGNLITFDAKFKSNTGKSIPLDVKTRHHITVQRIRTIVLLRLNQLNIQK